ncbi:CHAP domain-containing protein [Macrococcus bovicus]|uniref:CHAP domain-containing protein n=1 Tax=Macrococcus bovicus TaxID=69968 RepID=UPI0025A5D8E9|nr:CHAP domain-containing protein [Macrococcus bovicus]WJP97863.1 CHAP domain-containing protein [Macrococcus bovicus]
MKKPVIFIIIIVLGISGYLTRDTWTAYQEELKIRWMPDPMAFNTYDRGQCTFYVFEKVKADGKMIERTWHDAKYWKEGAEEDGYTVNQTPVEGALLQSSRGEQGHVAYVEHVYQNGKIRVSEMNYIKPYHVSERILTQEDIKRYQFIHPKDNPKS